MVHYEESELSAIALILKGDKKWFLETRLLMKHAWEIIDFLSRTKRKVRLMSLTQYKDSCKKVKNGRSRIRAILVASGVKVWRCACTGALMVEINKTGSGE